MPELPKVGGLKPPTELSEFLVYRAPYDTNYEVFVFPNPILPILDLYEKGKKSPVDSTLIKSYVFEDFDDLDCRKKLASWFKSLGIYDPERVVDKCSAWRLVHVQVPNTYYPPKYQGYPVREEDWKRVPTLIKKENRKKQDMFDPLTYLSDPTSTFNLDDLLK